MNKIEPDKNDKILPPTPSYFQYVLKEVRNRIIYINAFFIGSTINFLTLGHPFVSPVAFIIPWCVQLFSRASAHWSNRYKDMLLLLPLHRPDPSFIMNGQGDILLSSGNTQVFFRQHNISHLGDLSQPDETVRLLATLKQTTEFFSPLVGRWYQMQSKETAGNVYLIWLNDITRRKQLRSRLAAIAHFNNRIINDLDQLVEARDFYDYLAQFLLDVGYHAVFIAKQNDQGDMIGQIAKSGETVLIKSPVITLSHESKAPIFSSRRGNQRMIFDSIDNFPTRELFYEKYPFQEQVRQFIGNPIENFINYHESDISIIAFNRQIPFEDEEIFIEVLVQISRSVLTLIDLAITRQEEGEKGVTAEQPI